MRQNWRHLIITLTIVLLFSLLGAGPHASAGEANTTVPVHSSAKNNGGISSETPHEDMAILVPLYKKAMDAYSQGGYAEAEAMLTQVIDQRGLPPEIMEDALRKLADCTYFLGSTDGEKYYHQAIQHYHRILAMYPDVRAGNDLAHYRLAKSYEQVKNYQVAAEQFNVVIVKYPLSVHMPEVFAGIGSMAEKWGKIEYAIHEYRTYLLGNPEGEHAKIAFFLIGDFYYRLRQTVNADLWFRGALKKWPDLKELPRNIFRDIAFLNYQMGRYAEAISLFSLYVSIYPKDGDSPYIMYSLAHALAGIDQTSAAMKVFVKTSEEFPGTQAARDSAISIVDLGVEKSSLKAKIPVIFVMDNGYRDPLFAYDLLLARYPRGGMAEHLLYRKGYALFRGNRSAQAVQLFDRLLALNPGGIYSELGKRYLKSTAALAVDEAENDHLAVADVYFRSYGRHMLVHDDYATCYRMARSLVAIGLYAESLKVLKELVRREQNPNRRDALSIFSAEISRLEGRDKDAEETLLGLLIGRDPKNQEMAPRIKRDLARIYFLRGDWEKTVRNYDDIDNADRSEMTALDFQYYAQSLTISKRYAQSMANYRRAAKLVQDSPSRHPSPVLSEIYAGIGDCLYRQNNFSEGLLMYQQALSALRERRDLWWINSRIGQGYTLLNRLELGDKSFADAKATVKPEDVFAVKMIDAWKENSLWIEQNRKYVGLP